MIEDDAESLKQDDIIYEQPLIEIIVRYDVEGRVNKIARRK